MRSSIRSIVVLASLTAALILFSSCGKKTQETSDQSNDCKSSGLTTVAGSDGNANVFVPDPIAASVAISGNASISPTYRKLASLSSEVMLGDLGGRGVLEGKYVNVGTGPCNGSFHAYSETNDFRYDPSDPRFGEAMTYHYGSGYRAHLDNIGYLEPTGSTQMVTECTYDNAFFIREFDKNNQPIEYVCLGISSQNSSASFTHDATVSVHELQHATTTDTYSPTKSLGTLWYDEAGAMNEAISDFMALAYTAPLVPSGLDPRVFSRYALGTFYPGSVATRGANKCPVYDSAYPDCGNFGTFNSATNTLSYIYPDGLGWPYADNYSGPGKLQSAFSANPSQEEIHNAGVLLSGALWDAYDAVKKTRSGDADGAFAIVSKALMEGVRQLPKPSHAQVSPATFRKLASLMISSGSLLGLQQAEQDAITRTLTARGLYGGDPIPAGWASAAGIKILDNPTTLKSWFIRMGGDPSLIAQDLDGGANGKLDRGETVALWFNLRNTAPVTAGGITLTVQSLDPDVTFYDSSINGGAISDASAQIIYGKINGTSIVSNLSQGGASYKVATDNTYFDTNPFYANTWRTAIFAQVSRTAPHGKTVTFRITAEPSNGETAVVDFSTTIE